MGEQTGLRGLDVSMQCEDEVGGIEKRGKDIRE